ncbi:MAG: hypothetical protein ACRDPH_06045 [Marmoricola sp.]
MLVLQYVLGALCVLVAVWLLVMIARDRVPGDAVDVALVLVELGLVVQLVLGIIRLSDPHPGVSVPTYVGYLVGSLLILPAAWVWSQAERTRAGTAVLLVGVLIVPFLFFRLSQVWSLHA